ncbi:TPA: hypothetical protein R1765_001942 [Campylobacter coli]|nr:hypothetical protein [Campylobacter coli]
MLITNFLNTSELLQTLEKPEDFKRNKSKYIKLPKEGQRQYIEKSFKDTSIAIIKVTNDLLVLDCDNLYSYEYIKDILETHNFKTLITKSPYGGHFYFKVEKPLKLKHIKPLTRDIQTTKELNSVTGEYETSLDYYSQSRQLNIEFYDGAYGQGNKIIFDGANNPYYKVQSGDILEPQPITEDLINIFSSLSQINNSRQDDLTNMHMLGKKLFCPNRSKALFIKRCLANRYIDLYEFSTYYSNDNRKFDVNEALSGRNNFLQSVASWAGVSGFLDEVEWQEFVYLVNNEILKSNPLDLEEINKTILAKGKFEKYYFTEAETLKELDYMKRSSAKTYNIANSFIYIAFNLSAKNSSEQYLLVDLRKENSYNITFLPNKKAIEKTCNSIPILYDMYMKETTNSKGTIKIELDLDSCPLIRLNKEAYNDHCHNLYSYVDNYIVLNLGYFTFNPLINKILSPIESIVETNEVKLKKDFENTSFYKVLSNNLIPDKQIRAKFLGDLKNYLIHKSFLYNALIIKDIQGNTGKDSVLTRYLSHLIFGYTSKNSETYVDNIYAFKESYGSRSISASTFANEQFNGYLNSLLVVINEDGDNLNYTKFNKAYHKIIKQSDLEIREMHKGTYKVYNRIFTLRYTNSINDILDKSETNTRFYISEAQNILDLTNPEVFNSLFPSNPYNIQENPIDAKAKQETETILKYLLLCDIEDYCGYTRLPDNAEAAENNQEDDDIDTILSEADQSYTPYELAENVIASLVDGRGNINFEKLDNLLADKSHRLHDVALVINTSYARVDKDYVPEKEDYIITKDSNKNIGLKVYMNVSNFFSLLMTSLGLNKNIHKIHRQKIKALIVQRFTTGGNTNASRITFKGNKLREKKNE